MVIFTQQQKQTALWLSIGAILVVMLLLLGPILTPFIAGTILAYALNPGVDFLHSIRMGRFRLSRTLSALIVMVILLTTVAVLCLIMIPILIKEWPLLYEQIPNLTIKLNEIIHPLLHELGIDLPIDTATFKKLLTEQFMIPGESMWKSLLASAKIGGTTVLTWTWNLILIPVVLFYLLKDWHLVIRKLRNSIPRRWIHKAISLASEVNVMLAQYLRGQLSVMLILAIYYSSALGFVGYNAALPIGIISGMLAFIPYIGIIVGLSLAIIATMLQFSGMQAWITLAVIYGFGHSFDALLMTPTLVGRRIQLHPLIVIFALLAFGQLFGFVGVLIALPSSAILSVAFKHLRRHYINSNFYNS
ncbi:MAG: AI-2E family transporter [Betaproteobacteria bacterium]|nr:AI-2E family transporter [Betaproteobacteria bacterium]